MTNNRLVSNLQYLIRPDQHRPRSQADTRAKSLGHLHRCRHQHGRIRPQCGEQAGLISGYPEITKWLETLHAVPAFQRMWTARNAEPL
jgi:hypothetical protein